MTGNSLTELAARVEAGSDLTRHASNMKILADWVWPKYQDNPDKALTLSTGDILTLAEAVGACLRALAAQQQDRPKEGAT